VRRIFLSFSGVTVKLLRIYSPALCAFCTASPKAHMCMLAYKFSAKKPK
jgi:hypothetical protein